MCSMWRMDSFVKVFQLTLLKGVRVLSLQECHVYGVSVLFLESYSSVRSERVSDYELLTLCEQERRHSPSASERRMAASAEMAAPVLKALLRSFKVMQTMQTMQQCKQCVRLSPFVSVCVRGCVRLCPFVYVGGVYRLRSASPPVQDQPEASWSSPVGPTIAKTAIAFLLVGLPRGEGETPKKTTKEKERGGGGG